MSIRDFTSSLCKTIIERVRCHPEIWQFKHPMYKKRFVQQQFWEEMAVDLGVNDKVLKKRWKHLKDQYRKELKRAIEKDEEDTVGWQYFKLLSFYKDEILHRNRERAVAAAIDAESPENSEEDKPEPKEEKPTRTLNRVRVLKKKRDDSIKLNAIFKRLTQTRGLLETKFKEMETRNNDADFMFLVSLLPTIKQLTEVQKLQLRGKINDWLLEAITVKEYVNVCDEDNGKYISTVMEYMKCESE